MILAALCVAASVWACACLARSQATNATRIAPTTKPATPNKMLGSKKTPPFQPVHLCPQGIGALLATTGYFHLTVHPAAGSHSRAELYPCGINAAAITIDLTFFRDNHMDSLIPACRRQTRDHLKIVGQSDESSPAFHFVQRPVVPASTPTQTVSAAIEHETGRKDDQCLAINLGEDLTTRRFADAVRSGNQIR